MRLFPLRWVLLNGVLFAGWLGWLTYLVVTASHPVVLSRPQFLAADLAVVAQVREADGKPDPAVTVQEVAWAENGKDQPAGAQTITVANLPAMTRPDGWQGPGLYVLPLVKDGPSDRVPAIPRSPGFEPLVRNDQPRIYPRSEQTMTQRREIRPTVKE